MKVVWETMSDAQNDYMRVMYDEKTKPLSTYPIHLATHLVKLFGLESNKHLLDVGCGRGELLVGFQAAGLKVAGADISDVAKKLLPNLDLRIVDLERNGLPFPDDSFDIVFSKSVVEHLTQPATYLQQVFRVLRPGGLLITMTPSWEHQFRIFYADYTHCRPFTRESLTAIQMAGSFVDVHTRYFRQLPSVWRIPALVAATEIVRVSLPQFLSKYSKWIRFSKEIMLLSSARKPFTH